MEELVIGINYEAGKIIDHVLKYDECVAFANCQIVMDAPYHGRIANESIRSQGRSETIFKEYNEESLITHLKYILGDIKQEYKDVQIIIQIARGRSAKSMFETIISPLLTSLDITNYILVYGYKSINYFNNQVWRSKSFVFINIGMFAVVQNVDAVNVGQICNPNIGYKITGFNNDNFITDYHKTYYDTNKKNLLNKYKDVQKIILFGIDDNMEFITPDIYPKIVIDRLINALNI